MHERRRETLSNYLSKVHAINSQTEAVLLSQSDDSSYEVQESFQGTHITWTITDSDISEDGQKAVICSLNPFVTIFDLNEASLNVVQIDAYDDDFWSSRLFSIKFNENGSFLLGGTSKTDNFAHVILFDLEQQQQAQKLSAHKRDINAVCFLSKKQHNVFVSASDDSRIKLWDLRALGLTQKPMGYFLGHCSGITCVSTKEDERYLCSNSKDQSLKLWDMRKLESSLDGKQSQVFNFDYRNASAPVSRKVLNNYSQNDNFDASDFTMEGHSILRTLIKCHFSPEILNGSRFIYTGSADGGIHIFDTTTGKIAAVLYKEATVPIRASCWLPMQNAIVYGDFNSKTAMWTDQPDFPQTNTNDDSNSENFLYEGSIPLF